MRLVFSLSAGLLVVLGAFGLLLHVYLRHILLSTFDANLLGKAQLFALTTEQNDRGGLEFEFIESGLPEYRYQRQAEYFQVWSEDGKTVARSPSLGSRDLRMTPVNVSEPLFQDIVLPDGRPGRALLLEYVPPDSNEAPLEPGVEKPRLFLALASSTSGLERTLRKVVEGLAVAGLFLVAGVIPMVWLAVRRGLRSLDMIAHQASTIHAGNLSFRFAAERMPRELFPISQCLNDLLERLQTAFARERRFTADAAHELRTPIAELRTLAEVGLAEAGSTRSGMGTYFEDALGIARHLEGLVTTLLALARCEAGLQQVRLQPIDMADLVRSVWDSLTRRPSRAGFTAKLDLPERACVESDADLLKTILTNLLSNAISYTPDGGRIDVSVAPRGAAWVVSVGNTTDRLHPDDLERLFEPFWRKQQEQGGEAHCGVGLSLVAAYAKLLGIAVRAEMPAPHVLRIELACPSGAQRFVVETHAAP
jgi:two-component system sensor histidine kinase QseC